MLSDKISDFSLGFFYVANISFNGSLVGVCWNELWKSFSKSEIYCKG